MDKGKILLCVLALALSVSCTETIISEIEVPVLQPEKVSISSGSFSVPPEGGEFTVTVTSEGEWNIYGECGWCTPSAVSGVSGDEVTFTACTNIMHGREASFTFVCDNMFSVLDVSQQGAGPVPSDEIWYISADGNAVNFTLPGIASNTYQDGKGILKLENEVTSVGYAAFSGLLNLESVNLPGSIVSIASGAFKECHDLKYVNIPENVNSIGTDAFSSCHSLREANLPEGLTSVANKVFYRCYALEKAVIPETVTSIGTSSFEGCHALSDVHIPGSVTSVGEKAFADCHNLTGIVLPESLSSIGKYTFKGCYNLSSVTIPETVTVISDYAFSGCYSLLDFRFPRTMESIGRYVFEDCKGLTEITVPSSVTSIGSSAFDGCELKAIYMEPMTPPALIARIFDMYNVPKMKIYVPEGSAEAYKAAGIWSQYAPYMEEYSPDKRN
ncbi:MAG: leucine-rich repeat protein [Bacteroidales bacterium]|nr:leucine-rich repeat protein [Bacteroides sp.]MCM1198036.1 leucine-rich repeat protein [Clostridium sp.]MCM1503339.1 leucine-rich repeat protein [Bacteroidales bacterium]